MGFFFGKLFGISAGYFSDKLLGISAGYFCSAVKDLRPDLHVFGACVGSGETEEDNSYDQHPTILQKNTTSVYENGKKTNDRTQFIRVFETITPWQALS